MPSEQKVDFWEKNWKPKGVPVKIDKYFTPNVKNFIDDCIRDTFIEDLKSKGKYAKQDFYSFTQFVCILIAILSYLMDKMYKYPLYHNALFYSCVAYYATYAISLIYYYLLMSDLLLTCHEPESSGLDKGYLWTIHTSFEPLKAEFLVKLECQNLSNGKRNHGILPRYYS
ncbi:hypothetical protein HZS_759 [Henneguya salminicola]|nr:hypothetical protein HZS_759 [Henneguya salminicola]